MANNPKGTADLTTDDIKNQVKNCDANDRNAGARRECMKTRCANLDPDKVGPCAQGCTSSYPLLDSDKAKLKACNDQVAAAVTDAQQHHVPLKLAAYAGLFTLITVMVFVIIRLATRVKK